MDIDFVFWNLVGPVLRFPICLAVIISTFTNLDLEKTYLPLVGFSTVLSFGVWLNGRFKTRGNWVPLDQMKNATCVVTGGSSGLGLALVKTLLSRFKNAKVVIVDINTPQIADPRLTFYNCDLNNRLGVERTLSLIKKSHTKVDVLINNAGVRSKYKTYQTLQREEVDQVFQINVFAPMRFIQELIPKDPAKCQFYCVTVASALGVCPPAHASCYGASKAASIAFHEAWTQELRPGDKIRTLLVTPGQLSTKMFGGFVPPQQFFAPLVQPDELARVIVENCRIGARGEISAPLYANFMGLMRVFPYILNHYARRLSGIDSSLPSAEPH
ncbi:LAME_0E08328g1_1 [Lachancea meyersii CBS 8951]|uniref:LAME_0E08328g1_1 n=1 Tax=Lachancea meyersii CBS 8951 TaxID=1266667 RepID=A0A1G4JJ95_9SACH|nr:LAME_0E08328g1_1 [Lachancea meyersii CBS 8951]